jgi:hypothetical protein
VDFLKSVKSPFTHFSFAGVVMKERARIGVAAYGFAIVAALEVILVAPAAWGDDAPWLQPDSAGKYVFVNSAVYDVSTGKQVSPNGAPPRNEQPVLGAPGEYFTPGVVAGEGNLNNDGIESVGRLDDRRPNAHPLPALKAGGTGGQTSFSNSNYDTAFGPSARGTAHPTPIAARDQRRLVWVQDGDVWRGEEDWADNKIINAKQLTNVGVFQNLSPIVWWGQLLFVRGNFDPQKPIVRINLATGATDELPADDIGIGTGNGGSYISPNSDHVVGFTPDVIFVNDLRTGKRLFISNDIKIDVGQIYWLNDDILYVIGLGDDNGNVAKLDLRNGKAEWAIPSDSAQPPIAVISFVKDSNYVLATSKAAAPGQQRQSPLILIDLATGKRTTLPFDSTASAFSLDGGHYWIYRRDTGGLSVVGTWLYHLDTDSSVRLTPANIDADRPLLFPEQKQLWAVCHLGPSGGSSLKRFMLDDSGLGTVETIRPGSGADLRTLSAPIDIGLSGTDVGDLWKPVAVDAAALAPTEPLVPPHGKAKLFQDIDALPADDQAFAISAYGYADADLPYYDPEKCAMKALQAHKQQPSAPISTIMSEINCDDAFDHDRAVAYGQSRAIKAVYVQIVTVDDKEKIAELTGKSFADKLSTLTKPTANDINQTYASCFADAKKSVLQQNQTSQQPSQPNNANGQANNNTNGNTNGGASQQPNNPANGVLQGIGGIFGRHH